MPSKKYEGLDNIAKRRNFTKKSKKDEGSVTPNLIVSAAMHDVYGDDDQSRLSMFMKLTVSTLSMLATRGEDGKLFGKDFNEFFSLYVNTLNLCGRMKAALEENGIDFDVNDNSGDD